MESDKIPGEDPRSFFLPGGAGLVVVAVGWSFFMMIVGGPGVLSSLNNRCGRLALACGTVSGFFMPLLSVALASTVFLFYQLRHVKKPVANDAKKKPHDLVQTSSRDISKIVGRDELCNVIMEDIRDRDTRRPHLLRPLRERSYWISQRREIPLPDLLERQAPTVRRAGKGSALCPPDVLTWPADEPLTAANAEKEW